MLGLAIIIVYFIGLIAVGIYAYRNKNSSTGFGVCAVLLFGVSWITRAFSRQQSIIARFRSWFEPAVRGEHVEP